LEDGVFIAGGQAINLLAERYPQRTDDLVAYGPYTSKDLDYFGQKQAAEKLAEALGGRIALPEGDNHTPSSAQVTVEINGEVVVIDFLTHVMGVRDANPEAGALELVFPATIAGRPGEVVLPVMHPLHCLQSRVANIHTPPVANLDSWSVSHFRS